LGKAGVRKKNRENGGKPGLIAKKSNQGINHIVKVRGKQNRARDKGKKKGEGACKEA